MIGAMNKLAYLFPAFPVFHQTFVLWEVLGLQRNGLNPTVYSLRRPPAGRQQPEAEAVVRSVRYLPSAWSAAVRRANWRALRAAPRRYLALYLDVVRAWRTGPAGSVRDDGWEPGRVRVRDRLRGWVNAHPLPYLLKSLALVPIAVHLAERLADEGVTHLHVHWASYPATVAYVIHRWTGLPFSISAHAYDIYMVPRMLPAKVRAARFVVTCARTNAEFLRRITGPDADGKVWVSYHGVDVTRFTPPDSVPAPRPFTVVSCGQLERYKGMHLLVEACARLRRDGVDVECWIVGDGPYRPVLERLIETLGVGERVHLTGPQPHAEVAALLRRADAFALASELAGRRRDVIANVIVEAMAAGVPVVVSRIPGVEELIDDGATGYLVTPNRADVLAEALRRMATDPDGRRTVGLAGRRRVLQDFDNHKNVRALAHQLAAALAAEAPPERIARAG